MLVHSDIDRDARVKREAESLAEAGFFTTLLCLRGHKRGPDFACPGVRIHSIVDRRRENSSGLSRLFSIVPGFRQLHQLWVYLSFFFKGLFCKAEIVHAHDLNMLPLGNLLARIKRARLLYDSHELFCEKTGVKKNGLLCGSERKLIGRCDLVITTTSMRGDYLLDRYPSIRRLEIIHNYPRHYPVNQMDIRNEAGLPESSFVALYQGGIQGDRGLELMVQSAKLLADDACIVIQGDGHLFSELQRSIRESGSQKILLLPGGTARYLSSFTASADIGLQLLQPTGLNHQTALSNKLFEYAMAGLPVVATALPMITTHIKDYPFALYVAAGDAYGLAEAINSLANDRKKLAGMRAVAKKASLHFNWEREQLKLLSLYSEL